MDTAVAILKPLDEEFTEMSFTVDEELTIKSLLFKKLGPEVTEVICSEECAKFINVEFRENGHYAHKRLDICLHKKADPGEFLSVYPPIIIGEKIYPVMAEGYLEIYSDWDEEWTLHTAAEDEVDLTDNHWEVIKFLRDYFGKYQIAPMIKILTKEMKKMFGKEKGNTKYLYELFPAGPAKQGCRYAGIPKPTG